MIEENMVIKAIRKNALTWIIGGAVFFLLIVGFLALTLISDGSFAQLGTFVTILMVGAAIASAVVAIIGLVRFITPQSHKIYKSLLRYGDPNQLIYSIENEMRAPHKVVFKYLHFLKDWLVYAPGSDFRFVKYDDLVWVYQHVQTNRMYGVPVSRLRSLMLYDAKSEVTKMQMGRKEEAVFEAMDEIFMRAPWIFRGYSDAWLKGWNKDRQNFIAHAERNKQHIKSEQYRNS